MRRSDTIEGLTDKACYLRAMVDAGSLDAIEPFIVMKDRLKRKMEELNAVRQSNRYGNPK